MTVMYRCDRCGAVSSSRDGFHHVSFESEDTEGGFAASLSVAELDLCGDCVESLDAFLLGAPYAGTFGRPIEELDFSVRTFNCLKRAHIDTVGQLCAHSEADLLGIRFVGERQIGEIRERLESEGLGLRETEGGAECLLGR